MTPSGPAVSARARGCPPPAPWPPISAWPATRWPRSTAQLVAEGWLTARTGSGTSVAERRAADPGPGPAARPEAAAPRYDLRAGAPDLSAFPRGAWLAAGRKALAAAPRELLDYPDPRGLPRAAGGRWPATWPGPAAWPPTRPAS